MYLVMFRHWWCIYPLISCFSALVPPQRSVSSDVTHQIINSEPLPTGNKGASCSQLQMRKCLETKSLVKIFSQLLKNKLSQRTLYLRGSVNGAIEWEHVWVEAWAGVCVYVCKVCEPTTSGQLAVLHHQWHSGTCPLLRQEAMTPDRKWVTNNHVKSPYQSFIKSWWTLNHRRRCYSYSWRVIFNVVYCILVNSTWSYQLR